MLPNTNLGLNVITEINKIKAVKKILVIEDQEAIRKCISFMLKFENFDVYEAACGIRGLEMVKEINPDAILCDIMLPDIDGYEILKRMNKFPMPSSIPFIFLTALDGRDNFRYGMELGADDYLTKPFSRKELIGSISAQLIKHSKLEKAIHSKIAKSEKQLEEKIQCFKKELEEKNEVISVYTTKTGHLEDQLKEKDAELIKESLSLIETDNALQDLFNKIKTELQNPSLPEESKKVLVEIKNKIKKKSILGNNWTDFLIKFNHSYPAFISGLSARFEGLTQYDLVFISAHKMGFSTNQIAGLLNISDDSVRKSRYRIKKKLGLGRNDDFLKFIHDIYPAKKSTLNIKSNVVYTD